MHMTFYHTMKFTWKKVSALCEYRFNLQKANKHGTEAKLIDIQRGNVATRGWEKGRRGQLIFNGYRVSVLQVEKVIGISSDHGCLIM